MAILVTKRTRLIVQGLTGREGTFHAKACAAYGTQGGGRSHAGQGRDDVRRLADFQHSCRKRWIKPEPTRPLFSFHRRLPQTPSWKRPPPNSISSCASPKAFLHSTWSRLGEFCRTGRFTPDRAELSRHYLAGKMQNRNHAGIAFTRRLNIGIVSRSGTLTYEAVASTHRSAESGNRRPSASVATRSSAPTSLMRWIFSIADPETEP